MIVFPCGNFIALYKDSHPVILAKLVQWILELFL